MPYKHEVVGSNPALPKWVPKNSPQTGVSICNCFSLCGQAGA